jgi:sulfotransferase
MKPQIYFLSGLARSGSTLLGSILNQDYLTNVTPTSPLLDLICLTEQTLNKLDVNYTVDDGHRHRTIKSLIYANSPPGYATIFDKHRGWPRNIEVAQAHIDNEFKGIVTYRPIPEIITSFITLMKKDPNNFIDNHLRADGKPINVRNQADYLWRFYIMDPYQSTVYGLEHHRRNILPISYDEITEDTVECIRKIRKFFDMMLAVDHDFEHISNTCAEAKDEAWGLKNLHTIRPIVQKTSVSARDTLGDELFEFYNQFNLKL